MINTSAQYKQGIRTLPVQQHTLSAMIEFADGSVTAYLTQANFLEGSMQVTNQLANSGNVCVGTAYIGSLECTLIMDGIPYDSLRKAVLTLSMTVWVGNTYEEMPLGRYTISSATLTDEGIKITAYDDMAKFDKDLVFPSNTTRTKTAYEWYIFICNQCSVAQSSRMTQQYFVDTFWCGNANLALYQNTGDVVTWRGLVAKLSQMLCAYAVVDRYGNLVIVPANVYAQTSEYLLDTAAIIDSFSIADYHLKFGGFYCKLAPNGKDRYYGYSPDGCAYMQYEVLPAEKAEVNEKINYYTNEISAYHDKIHQAQQDWMAGKISEQEMARLVHRYEDEIYSLTQRKTQCEDEVDEIDAEISYYQAHSNPLYADALNMNFGYNPFINSFTKAQKWDLATAIMQIVFTPFEYTMVGDYGYELGDPVYIDASAGTFGIVMAYTIDEYCVKIECFGAQGELQSAKAIEQSKIQGIANNVTNLENQMNEVFQSVSSGKDELAAAITGKGVTTYSDDTFADMATNILKIQTGGGKPYKLEEYEASSDTIKTGEITEVYNVNQ